jgi:DNA-binding beta-propeller fold protein YncE
MEKIVPTHTGKFLAGLFALTLSMTSGTFAAPQPEPLVLVQTISIPNLKGRIDHMDVDVKGQRLFIAGLDNGSVEIVDLRAGKWVKSTPGFQKPQGIAYVAPLNRLFVASGNDGMLRIFQGDTFQLLDSVKLELGPNRVTYDPRRKLLYVGYGGKDAGKTYGEVGIVDARTHKRVGDVEVAAHPAELLLADSGRRLFTLIPAENRIQVIDTARHQVISSWPVSNPGPGDAALDEASNRLFIGTHGQAPQLIVMDSRSGKEVARLPAAEGMDGVYFDATHKRIYVSGGRWANAGQVFVYQQNDVDHYEIVARIPTRPGAGTSFWSPQLNRYYVAAPAHEQEGAAILVFEPRP